MSLENQAKIQQVVRDFMDENKDIYHPSEEIENIIKIVREESDEKLLKLKIQALLIGFANKVSKFQESHSN